MKNALNFLLFIFSAIAVHGQVNLAVIPDTRDLRTDQQLRLTVALEIRGDEDAQQSNLRLPDFSKFTMVGTASKRNTDINAETLQVINQFIYQVVLQPKQAGKIKIGSFLITVNNKIYKTEPFDVYITKADPKTIAKTNAADDMYLNLEVKDKNIYKNQPTLAVLKVYSKDINNFRNLSHIKVPQNSGVNFRQVDFTKSDIEQNSSGKMASQVVGVFLISTTESGTINVPPVSAVVKNRISKSTLKSNNVSLNVKKLPSDEPSNYKNAIGDFKIKLSKDRAKTYSVGNPVNVKINISGEGNFKSMNLPRLTNSPNYTFFPPKIIYNTKSSSNGFTGNVELQYVVIPKKSGKIMLKSEAFSFFNPAQHIYDSIKADTLSFVALSQEQISDAKSTIEKVNDYTANVLETVNTPKISGSKQEKSTKTKLNYKVILGYSALVLALLFLLFRFRNKKKNRKKITLKPVENISETEARLQSEKTLDLDVEIAYLEKLKDSKNYTEFFKDYDSLLADLEQFAQKTHNISFSNYLQREAGAKQADDFIILREEFAVEKFAPFQSEENINSLFSKLKKLLSEIKE
ncbi:Oxygen tolerance [Halpernia humi]|uniref:Oxygen tolerance n=1 Tax=Halpernia humi TaxID=493375 RepID=A0A1H5UC87_9FLAO|nr:BatD family protein [Halpernia humi]SEF72722.1 Oxygen tolerance [Halpernia humi]